MYQGHPLHLPPTQVLGDMSFVHSVHTPPSVHIHYNNSVLFHNPTQRNHFKCHSKVGAFSSPPTLPRPGKVCSVFIHYHSSFYQMLAMALVPAYLPVHLVFQYHQTGASLSFTVTKPRSEQSCKSHCLSSLRLPYMSTSQTPVWQLHSFACLLDDVSKGENTSWLGEI